MRSAVLATAGGLVFAGALDRVFSAYDAATGTQLWKTRLNQAAGEHRTVRLRDGYSSTTLNSNGPMTPG
jgi:ferric-dicitrate binding protein FerR (iron transport regulator)